MIQEQQNRRPIGPQDLRLQHLRANPSFRCLDHMWDYTDYVLDALAPKPGMVIVYSFDGELDDDLRLEHLLLHWSSMAELIIVAGQRYDGDDTYEELKGVVTEVLGCASLPNGRFITSHNIRLIRGGPLSSLTDFKEDLAKSRTLRNVAVCLAQAIGARPFVFHNNTSFSLLDQLLCLPAGRQLKACSSTCSIAAPPGFLCLAANASWDRPAFERVLEHAKKLDVPCLLMHGSLAGWKRQVLPELENWAVTMLAPAATELAAKYARKMVRFAMGIALEWSARAYASAKSLTGAQMQAVVDRKLASTHFTVEAGPKPSDQWAKFVTNLGAGWSSLDPAGVASTFRAMAANAGCMLSNTVGDLSGCPLDVPRPKRNKMVILRLETLVDKGVSPDKRSLGFEATIGTRSYAAKGGIYILAHAQESETLDTAWASIRRSRATKRQTAQSSQAASTRNQYPILNGPLAAEWLQYKAIFEFFLRGILDNMSIFPTGSKAFVDLALTNLEKGEMTRLCQQIHRSNASVPASRRASTGSRDSMSRKSST